MMALAWLLVAGPLVLLLYTYAGYPLILLLLGKRHSPRRAMPPQVWPTISITVPVYNEEAQVRGLIESLLGLDYPEERRQILIVSDASTDRTDAIIAEYRDRGVELLRMPRRGGKTTAENAAAVHLRGELVLNTDASIRLHRDALKLLVAEFADPTVGVASGRDISVAQVDESANAGESRYVDYEMWVRALETRVSGIIGASGCCYAIRAHLHRVPLPSSLSRDFAAAMLAREQGFRAVSVDEALCYVPRTSSLRREYHRKVRTITRGIETLARKRHLLNPARHGAFAWMLLSHKLCRWLVPWAMFPALAGLLLLSLSAPWARVALGLFGALIGLGAIGWLLSGRRTLPGVLSVAAFALAGHVAALHATLRALHGDENPIWEPTRRLSAPQA